MEHHLTSQSRDAIKLRPNTKMERRCTIRFPQTYIILGAWFEGTFMKVSVCVYDREAVLMLNEPEISRFRVYMETLVADMVQDDPAKRPKMDEVHHSL